MYMAPGSADCQYAIRELTTGIKEAKVADMQAPAGLARCFIHRTFGSWRKPRISGVLLRYIHLGETARETNSLWRVQNQHLRFWLDRRIVLSLYYCTANYLDSWGCQPRCGSIWIQVRQKEFPEASSRKSQVLKSKEHVGATGATPEEGFISSEGKRQRG